MTSYIGRRRFLASLGGAAAAWPLAAGAQQSALPVVGFVRDGTANASAHYVAAFRKGLSEIGVVEGQNVTVEYHWLEGRHDRLPSRRNEQTGFLCLLPPTADIRAHEAISEKYQKRALR
jgi:hypothetical protein